MVDIIKHSDLKPVSFEQTNNGLTHGQMLMLKLFKDCLDKGKPITPKDVRLLYLNAMKGGNRCYGSIRYWNSIKGCEVTTNKELYYDYCIEAGLGSYRCKQWFKANIGACVLKGKLLAIPVIEL